MTSPNLKTLYTKPVDQLYHQFLKPLGISRKQTIELSRLLYNAGFISLVNDTAPDIRYVENTKLTDRLNRDELFKLVHSLK